MQHDTWAYGGVYFPYSRPGLPQTMIDLQGGTIRIVTKKLVSNEHSNH